MNILITRPEHFLGFLKKRKEMIALPIVLHEHPPYGGTYAVPLLGGGRAVLAVSLLPTGFQGINFVKVEGNKKFEGYVAGIPELTLEQNYFENDWQLELDKKLPTLTVTHASTHREGRAEGTTTNAEHRDYGVFRHPLTSNFESMANDLDDDQITRRRNMQIELTVRPYGAAVAIPRAVPAPLPPPYFPAQAHYGVAKYPNLQFTVRVELEAGIDVPRFEEELRRLEFDIYDGSLGD